MKVKDDFCIRTNSLEEAKALLNFLEGYRNGVKDVAQPESLNTSVLDDVSWGSWHLFDVISSIGVRDGDFISVSVDELLDYEVNGKKPFTASSVTGRIAGSNRVARRLGQKEIFSIHSSKNRKLYRVRSEDRELFKEKIESWCGEYEEWLQDHGFGESPLLMREHEKE